MGVVELVGCGWVGVVELVGCGWVGVVGWVWLSWLGVVGWVWLGVVGWVWLSWVGVVGWVWLGGCGWVGVVGLENMRYYHYNIRFCIELYFIEEDASRFFPHSSHSCEEWGNGWVFGR